MSKTPIHRFKKILLAVFFMCVLGYGAVFGVDQISQYISEQTSAGTGSNNSQISFLTGGSSDPAYVNAGNNSTIIGNYFSGYYYDSVYGFFRLDWDTDTQNNVHIIGSTGLCPTGYGYRIGGYAYSELFGLIDFNYDGDTFVYYCLDDAQMHGYGYGTLIGFQNFEGIGFQIVTSSNNTSSTTSNSSFSNDTTSVTDTTSVSSQTQNASNADPNRIETDVFELIDTNESIFYIIK